MKKPNGSYTSKKNKSEGEPAIYLNKLGYWDFKPNKNSNFLYSQNDEAAYKFCCEMDKKL